MWRGTPPRNYKKNQAKGKLEVLGSGIFRIIIKKTGNDSVPGGSLASDLKKKAMRFPQAKELSGLLKMASGIHCGEPTR